MRALVRYRIVAKVLLVLIVAGMFACMLEVEGPGHQQEAHHCVTCCTSHHVSVVPLQEAVKPSLQVVHAPVSAYSLSFNQVFLSPQTPPPKFSL